MEKRKYYQPEIETMPVEQIKKLQSAKLVKQGAHVYKNVPYYRELQSGKPCPNSKHTWSEIRGLSKRNTSIATYVWLPVRFDESGKPYISWSDEWSLEDFE